MITRPLAILSAAVIALGAIAATGCGDSSSSDEDSSTATSSDNPKASTSDASKSEASKSESGATAKAAVTFGQQSASGEAAIAQTQGAIDNPEIIRLRVTAQPQQKAMVSYTLLCTVAGKTGGDNGQFSATTPIDREVEIPDGKPTECTVSANAQLETGSSGKVTMKLRGRER